MAAQAARLSLRMQKELKLLLSDPPPGASFPRLSSDSIVSLSSIDAQIKGPAGTVYENGIFSVKIRIPDRYPFQPPIVTFATPIYHPNIDTGGRICLDILNLPPKGAWQPSLNISTVLTSIGLLLSDPNPDDGLMCEASREFKYNRQAFDKKARSMTEEFAHHEATENIGINIEAKATANELNPEATRIESEASCTNKVSVESSNSQMGIEVAQSESIETFVRGKKLSLKSSSNTGKRIDIVNEDLELKKLPGMSEVKMEKKDDVSRIEARSQKNVFDGIENGSFGTSRTKLSLGSKKLCLDLLTRETHSQQESGCGVKETLSQQDSGCSVKALDSESRLHEAVIVLDSEDSDEEEDKKRASLRSKPMLSQKRLGKWKL